MPVTSIADLITLRPMNAPRTELVLSQMRPLARELADARLVDLIDWGYEASGEVTALNARRKLQTTGRSDVGAADFDTVADDITRPLIRSLIDSEEFMRRTGHSHASRLARLKAVHFPVGPGDIISQRFEEQYHRMRALVADLRGPYADLIPELEIELKLRRVEAQLGPYGAALAARRKVSAADVSEAAKEMHRRMLIIVAHVIATWHDQPSAFDQLLLPLIDQQQRIAAIMRARRAGASVDDDPTQDADDVMDPAEVMGDDPGEAAAGLDAPDDPAPVDAAPAPDRAEADVDGSSAAEDAPALGEPAPAMGEPAPAMGEPAPAMGELAGDAADVERDAPRA